VTVSQQAADTARRAEVEHEDDFERAFEMTCGLIATVIEQQAQRRYTLRSSLATLRFDSSALDSQELQNKRVILQALSAEPAGSAVSCCPPTARICTGRPS
jgi:hypothetical protein